MSGKRLSNAGSSTKSPVYLRSLSKMPGLRSGFVLLFGFAALAVLFRETVASAIHLWQASSTYTYCYLIIPISGYLIWEDRAVLARMAAKPSGIGIIVVGVFSAAWLLADLLGIDEGRQIAFVGMTQGLVLGVLGTAIYRKIIFPLNYLWLLVPTGEFLLAPLQTLAHAGAVVMLQLSGIPVFAEGILIQVPQGNFLVEPGCAGLNFLLSSLALSLVYGRLIYTRLSERILCVVVALGVSVIANIVRIYLIIALTEWTNQRLDIADDHLLYGWGFFAVIMLGLMWAGAKNRGIEPSINPQKMVAVPSQAPSTRRAGMLAVIAVCVAAVGPALASMTALPGTETRPSVMLPDQLGPWRKEPATALLWRPALVPSDATVEAVYSRGPGEWVEVVAALYQAQHDGREAAAAGNGPADGGAWRVLRAGTQAVRVADTDFTASAATVQAGSSLRAVVYWYETDECLTGSRLRAKICAARQRLSGHPSTGAFVALSAVQGSDQVAAEGLLRDVAQRLPVMATTGSLNPAVRED